MIERNPDKFYGIENLSAEWLLHEASHGGRDISRARRSLVTLASSVPQQHGGHEGP